MARKVMLLAVGRDHSAACYRTTYGFDILLPAWDANVIIAAVNGRILHPRLTEILVDVIKPGDTFVDAGANMGFYSLLAATRLAGRGRVISFEPDPRNLPTLRSNVEMNRLGDIICIEPRALSDKESELDFWRAPENTWAGSIVKLPGTNAAHLRVPATSLDEYIGPRFSSQVDVIKIDIEGAEPLALEGMSEALRTAKLVAYEINKPRLDELNIRPMDLIKRTNERGLFEITLVSDERTDEFLPLEDARSIEILNSYGWANVVSAKGNAARRLRDVVQP